MTLAQGGAFGFGLVIGWFLYLVNRYRRDDVTFGDLTTILGAIGGAAVTRLFGDADGSLFGCYGIGLAIGFFGYFLILITMVAKSPNFDIDYFLDGRRKSLTPGTSIPDGQRQAGINMDKPTGR
jgi:hypothetical protein